MQSHPPTPEEVASRVDSKLLAQELLALLQKDDHASLWISREDHALQHAFVKTMMDKERRKAEWRQGVKEKFIGAAVVGSALSILGYIGKTVIEFAHAHLSITINH